MEKEPRFTLEDLSSTYSVVLLDTSVLLQILGQERHIAYANRFKLISPIMTLLEKSANLIVTPKVVEEYLSKSHCFSHQSLGWKIDFKLRKELIELFSKFGKVLSLDKFESNFYNHLCEMMPSVFKCNSRDYRLSETDKDICLSATAMAFYGKKNVAVISNDFGISCGVEHLRDKAGLSEEKLSFFLRVDYNLFRRKY